MNQQFHVTELGLKRMNPLAHSTNMWKLTTDLCDCTQDATCMDVEIIDVNPARSVVSIVVDGNTVALAAPVSTADLDDLKDALETAINTYENAPYFELIQVGDSLMFKHYGATVVSQINYAEGAPSSTYRTCIVAKHCTFTGQADGDIINVELVLTDGTEVSDSVMNGPFAHSGTVLTDEATAAALQVELYAALNGGGHIDNDGEFGVNAITVTNNPTDNTYDIVLPRLIGINSVTILGNTFTRSNCVDDFSQQL